MFLIKPLPTLVAWLDGLADPALRGAALARIKRLERGLMGDVAPMGEGVSELRIQVGAARRIYFVQRGGDMIVLLAGGEANAEGRHRPRARHD